MTSGGGSCKSKYRESTPGTEAQIVSDNKNERQMLSEIYTREDEDEENVELDQDRMLN